MTNRLREAMHRAVDDLPAVRLSEDPWRQGRRMRRRQSLLAAAATVLVVFAVAMIRLTATPYSPAAGGDAVPGEVHTPWMWQATVQMDPQGAASVLMSGDGLGLTGIDLFDHEGKVAVVGRDGSYRMLLYGGASQTAGVGVVLSPDGRFVAQQFLADEPDGSVVITDLVTGLSRRLSIEGRTCCGIPLAWSRDGTHLAVVDFDEAVRLDHVTGYGVWDARLVVYDVATGKGVRLAELGGLHTLRKGSLVAFSPDGERIALNTGGSLKVMDLTGENVWTAQLGHRRYLAGVGAWRADGRITTVSLDGCLDDCDPRALAARQWGFGYVDAATGKDTQGPALSPVQGLAVRALGWRYGTDLVALVYAPEPAIHKTSDTWGWDDTGFRETDHVRLLALRPDGGVEVLLDPPDEVLAMDVSRDLLEAGRFGGPASQPSVFPARKIILFAAIPLAPILLVAAVIGALIYRRIRRPGSA